jgi:hypothetical protein
MFESWVETIGGILDVAGVTGLLANAGEFRPNRADQVAEWRTFVAVTVRQSEFVVVAGRDETQARRPDY